MTSSYELNERGYARAAGAARGVGSSAAAGEASRPAIVKTAHRLRNARAKALRQRHTAVSSSMKAGGQPSIERGAAYTASDASCLRRTSALQSSGDTAIRELLDPGLRSTRDHDRNAPEIRGPFDTGEEDRGPQLDLECREPIEARLLALERGLKERPADADGGGTESERFRGVESAAHSAGRDEREPRGGRTDDSDGGRQPPVAEPLAEAHTERISRRPRAHRLDRRERRA